MSDIDSDTLRLLLVRLPPGDWTWSGRGPAIVAEVTGNVVFEVIRSKGDAAAIVLAALAPALAREVLDLRDKLERHADTGLDRAPDRYMGHGRETVDRMRDTAYVAARWLADYDCDLRDTDALADALFAFACETHALKYEDRCGRKGDPAVDAAKATFWRGMAAHVRNPEVYPDPRSGRPGFTPYVRPGGAS